MSDNKLTYQNMPVIALRGLVVFPKMVLHFDVGREKSIQALKYAMEHTQQVFLTAQKDVACDNPGENDLYALGMMAEVKQMLKIPNSDNMRVVVEGEQRAYLTYLDQETPFLMGCVSVCEEAPVSARFTSVQDAYVRTAKTKFEAYCAMIPKVGNEVVLQVMTVTDPGELADLIASNSYFSYEIKQKILSELNPVKRLMSLCIELEKEMEALKTEIEIQEKLQDQVDKNQREYYLREEMKVIADELGDGENPSQEAEVYAKKIRTLPLDDTVKDKLLKECDRLMKMPSGSHEGTVVRSYLDTCLELPFGIFKKESIHLEKAQKLLDREHYGLDQVKKRILESLAVRKLAPDMNGQILCLAGPPGVGKTSIAKSLAKAMGRTYMRISLGGIRDESDIRGHRKTYIGSMPGRILSALKNSGSMNPMILLDEIDKLGTDGRGDPASALLEALDPEQNHTFTDHYIDFPVDLSKVMFITTANDLGAIPGPLLDRMEVIELYSYTHEEKFQIAKRHLIKKQIARHGLTAKNTKITDEALHLMIERYTREAGVRQLERQIASVCRKAAMRVADDTQAKFQLTPNHLHQVLGSQKYKDDFHAAANEVGVVNGLAWTSVGGTMLPIEISAFPGSGKIKLTGNLGDVMQESAETAVSYIRSKAEHFGIDSSFYKNKDIHIHAPESAVPKDGPSAGIAITTALVSELTGAPVNHLVAMTGEISLKGKVLPIGGLKEKSMAAYRTGIQKVIIPFDNLGDLDEIDAVVKEKVCFYPVKTYEQVMELAFVKMPEQGKQQAKPLVMHGDQQGAGAVAQ